LPAPGERREALRRRRRADLAADHLAGEALHVHGDQPTLRRAPRDQAEVALLPGQRADLPDPRGDRRQVARPDRRGDGVDPLAAGVGIRRIIDVAEGRAELRAQIDDGDALAAQVGEQRLLVRRRHPRDHRSPQAEPRVDHGRVVGGTARLRRLLTAADRVEVARDRPDDADVEHGLRQGSLRQGAAQPPARRGLSLACS